jgi:hypothetical protein
MTNDSVAEAHDFPEGLPIYDCHKEKLGTVSAFGVQSTYLVMHTGRIFHHDVSIPLSAIQRSDGQGVYLNRTRQEIRNLTLGGWSSLGNIDLNTGVGAGDDVDPVLVVASSIASSSEITRDVSQSAAEEPVTSQEGSGAGKLKST